MNGGERLAIGAVTRPHGIRGKIRISYLGDDPRDLLGLQEIFIGSHPDDLRKHRILHVQSHKGLSILELEGFSLKEAQESVGQSLWVDRDQLPPLREREYYWTDMIGLRVVAEGGEELGIVRHIMETGGGEVLVCAWEGRERLIPFVEDVVIRVDLENGLLLVRPVEGLW
jgi:16S rRNA processing protein RimM